MQKLRISSIFALTLAAGAAFAADWPQFRGPNRDGISRDTGLLKAWPSGGPRVLWKVPLGEGYSGLTVAGGRLYTQVGKGKDDLVLALDAKTGKEIWRFRADAKFDNDMGGGSRSTPTFDGGLLYALTAMGKLWALDAKTGKKVWGHDLRQEFGAKPPQWGVSTSPLVEGNLLLVDVGGVDGKSAMAFDKKTGKVVWASQSDSAGYSAPIAITVGGVRQVIFFTGTAVASLSPANGKLFWRVPWRTDWDVNAATPIFVAPDKLFISSGYDTGAALFRITTAGGKPKAEQVWKSRDMKNQFSSSVLSNGVLYGFDNTTLKALDAATGDERWKERGFGHGSLILAEGHLYVLSDRGKLSLVQAAPGGFTEKSSFQALSGKCWTAPTVANGILYVRNEEELKAFDVAAPK